MVIWIRSPESRSRNFIFLDRDGVINVDRSDYVKHWDEVQFYPDALEALRWLSVHDINVILISNQSALNRGIMDWEDFLNIHERMTRRIEEYGGKILAAFYCPHRPEERCNCRKPSPGMILVASEIYRIPLEGTWMIGDRATDVETAIHAGCGGVLLERGVWNGSPEGSQRIQSGDPALSPHYPSLLEAVLDLF